MRKFLFNIIFLLILPCGVVGYLLQSFIDKKLLTANLPIYKEWNKILNSRVNADLIIQGSSRARQHFSPFILDSTLSIHSYNTGIDGFDFIMEYHRFILYLKHNKKPRYIIQNVDHFTFAKRDNLIAPEQFIPYLNNDIIKEAVSHYKGFDKKDFYLPCLKYAHTAATKSLIIQSLFRPSRANSEKYKGFLAVNKKWDPTFFNSFFKANPHGYHLKVNRVSQAYFEEYLKVCKKEKVQVIFVYSPEYYKAQKLILSRDSVTNIFKNYASTYGIPFLDYSRDSICLDTSNFYNSQHLNANGVKKFNYKLVNDLRSIIE